MKKEKYKDLFEWLDQMIEASDKKLKTELDVLNRFHKQKFDNFIYYAFVYIKFLIFQLPADDF